MLDQGLVASIVEYFQRKYPNRFQDIEAEESFTFLDGNLTRLSYLRDPNTGTRDQIYFYSNNVEQTRIDFESTAAVLEWARSIQETERKMDRNDAYAEVYRGMIRHEDKLRDDRTKALLTIQAFLIGAAGTAVRFLQNDDQQTISILILSVVGFVTAVAFCCELFNNTAAIDRIIEDYESTLVSRSYQGPKVIGVHTPGAFFKGANFWLSTIFALMWVKLFVMYLGILNDALRSLFCPGL